MARVERFTKTILPDRRDPGAIDRAGATARAVGQFAEIGLAFREAKDANFVTERSAQLEREVDDFFEDFKVTAASDPDGRRSEFDQFINKRFGELSKDASPEALGEFTKIKDDIAFRYDDKYESYARRQNISNFGKSFANSIDDIGVLALRAGQNGEDVNQFFNRIDASLAAGSTFIGAPNLADLRDESRTKILIQYLEGSIERDPIAARSIIDSEQFDKDLTADSIQSLQIQAQRREAYNEAQANKVRAEQTQEILDDIDLRTFSARNPNNEIDINQNDINELLESGVIDTGQYIKRSRALEEALQNREQSFLDGARFAAFNNGTLIFDPTNSEHKKAGDRFYEQSFLPQALNLPPEQQITQKAQFAVDKGFVPEALKSEITGNLLSGSPTNKATAANLMNDIVARAPTLARQFRDSDLSFATKLSEGVNAGLPVQDAVDFAQSQVFLKGTPEYQARLARFNDEKDDFNRSKVQTFFRNDPEIIPSEMATEWETLYRFYNTEQGVDNDKAQNLAYQKLQSTWGVSRITGDPKWVKWAPEAYYSVPGIKDKWMNNQLAEIIKEHRNLPIKQARKFIDESVELVPDLRTVRSGQPAYRIIQKLETQDGNFVLDSLRTQDDQELFWIPSFSETPEAKKLEAEYNQSIESMKQGFEKTREENREFIEKFGVKPRGPKVISGPEGKTLVRSIKEGF